MNAACSPTPVAALRGFLFTLCLLPAALWSQPAAAGQVSITITKVKCIDDCRNTGLEAAGESAADFYAKVWINGVLTQTPRGDEDQDEITPNWVVNANIPTSQKTFTVGIQIWDHDSTSGDDLGDASPPAGGDNNLDFTVDALTGRWTGDVNWPDKCAQGGNPGGDPAVQVCFELGGFEDTDGDGLLDDWERNGLDVDRDGIIDINLPAMGADPRHKDLFVELDWMAGNAPTRQAIQAWKAAFAAAPLDAGRTDDPKAATINNIKNPDGQPGINLWVDTGGLRDVNAAGSEGGAGPNTCGDGVDNDGDGLIDGNDPECRTGPVVGDNFGGGNLVPTRNLSGLTATFYTIKSTNFDVRRLPVFRYALSAARPTNNRGTSTGANAAATLNDTSQTWLVNEWAGRTVALTGGTGSGSGQVPTVVSNTASSLTVNPPWTTLPDNTSTYLIAGVGGDGEVGGNDFVEFNHDPGTLMHEFGHNLNLQHGGNTSVNCKPNYISVMNYDLQFGIQQVAGSGQGQDFDLDGVLEIIDYSPPRFPGGRGVAPVQQLLEAGLPEGAVLDATDAANQTVYTRGAAGKFNAVLNQGIDWAGDGPTAANPLNINTSGANGRPAACTNTTTNETLTGFEDWHFITLSPWAFPDSADGAINRVNQPEPTLDDRKAMHEELNTTDLVLTMTATADVPVAGQEIIYRFTVKNNGPRVARRVQLANQPPADLVLTAATSPCAIDAPARTLQCELGELRVGEQRAVEARFHVPVDLPCPEAQQFIALDSRAHVLNVPGPDANPRDNEASTTTRVLCVRFEYVAKLVCGTAGEVDGFALAPGHYATAINIHNPNDEQAHFFKKVALTGRDQKPGRVHPVAIDALRYDEALRLDCTDLRGRLPRADASAPLLEGFVVVQSPRSLDVAGVYTSAARDCTGSPSGQYRRGKYKYKNNPKTTYPADRHDPLQHDIVCSATSAPGLHVETVRERARPLRAPRDDGSGRGDDAPSR